MEAPKSDAIGPSKAEILSVVWVKLPLDGDHQGSGGEQRFLPKVFLRYFLHPESSPHLLSPRLLLPPHVGQIVFHHHGSGPLHPPGPVSSPASHLPIVTSLARGN